MAAEGEALPADEAGRMRVIRDLAGQMGVRLGDRYAKALAERQTVDEVLESLQAVRVWQRLGRK